MSVQPLGGPGDLGKAIEAGRDPNADLDKAVEGESANRAAAAVAMKVAGASYSEIARTLGFSSAFHARSAVERSLAASADNDDDRAKLRVLTTRRLERLLKSVMARAVNPNDPDHLAYNARALAIIDREARLHGIDAPTQAIVHTPDSERVEKVIGQVLALARTQMGEAEQDIIEAELED